MNFPNDGESSRTKPALTYESTHLKRGSGWPVHVSIMCMAGKTHMSMQNFSVIVLFVFVFILSMELTYWKYLSRIMKSYAYVFFDVFNGFMSNIKFFNLLELAFVVWNRDLCLIFLKAYFSLLYYILLWSFWKLLVPKIISHAIQH